MKSVKKGDLIMINPAPISRETNVIVESMNSQDEYILVSAGTYAIFLRSTKKRIEVMVDNFVGWIFPDEWSPISLAK